MVTKMVKNKSRTVLFLFSLALVISQSTIVSFAFNTGETMPFSSGFAFSLTSEYGSEDSGILRYKNDYTNADVYPSDGSRYTYGMRFGIFDDQGYWTTGYTERYNLNPFSISYREEYAEPGYRQLRMCSVSASVFSVSVSGTWYP